MGNITVANGGYVDKAPLSLNFRKSKVKCGLKGTKLVISVLCRDSLCEFFLIHSLNCGTSGPNVLPSGKSQPCCGKSPISFDDFPMKLSIDSGKPPWPAESADFFRESADWLSMAYLR